MEAGRCGVGFGPHLVFHGFRCPASRLDDLGHLYRLLDELPERIHMTKIMPPYVLRHDARGGAEKGFSGFVLIAQSHISIHTFPSRGLVSVDVFSCEVFDVEDAIAELRRSFRPRRIEWQLLDRGSEFPRGIAGSRAVVGQERRRVASALGLEALR
jgi:S-adenosylmethionine decarboxylase